MTRPEQANYSGANSWLFLRITGVVLLVMLLISAWARSYSEHISLPRYCDAPQSTLTHLEQVLREPRPAGEGSRRPYIIAAKLRFLLPRQSDETEIAYLSRIRKHIENTC
ncbi:MAG: hypothetical protein GXP08_15955 [Gammaproteobacteria bacterium]|nr:hypothetical protein [Gammaproteobacteria bacterium]